MRRTAAAAAAVETRSALLRVSAALALAFVFSAAHGASAQDKAPTDVPRCSAVIASLAVVEPDNRWWEQFNLGSPASLIKVFVDRSGCFTLVDRGAGLEAAQRERALADGGELQKGTKNFDKGQIAAADYVLIPNLVTSNRNSSGRNIGGVVGGFLGGTAGAIAGGINTRTMTADVTLTLTDTRTTKQLAAVEGNATKRDIGFSGGTGIWGGGGFGAAGLGGYQNTEIGKVITAAYLDSYNKLVDQMGGVSAEPAADGGKLTVVMTRTGTMYEKPSSRSTAIRVVETGTKLFPTGKKEGLMWEVTDDKGARGWVTSVAFREEKQ
jgi:curli biogenesis system outer membrane secretion channel CsgG